MKVISLITLQARFKKKTSVSLSEECHGDDSRRCLKLTKAVVEGREGLPLKNLVSAAGGVEVFSRVEVKMKERVHRVGGGEVETEITVSLLHLAVIENHPRTLKTLLLICNR